MAGIVAVSLKLVLTLGLLTSIGPITMELYTPSLPAMAAEFNSTISQMQATISSMLVTFSLAQLAIGSLSDSMGRKPMLLIGMGVYVLASVSASLAGGIAQLQLQRAVQGVGSAIAMVTGQALVRDLFPDLVVRTRITGRLASVRASCPLLAPAIGAYLQLWLGWRSTFGLMAACGGFAAFASSAWLPTDACAARPSAVASWAGFWSNLARTTRLLAADARFVANAGADTLSFIPFILYVTASSYVLQTHYAVPLSRFPLIYGVGALGLLCGTELSPRLSAHWGPGANARVLRVGLGVSLGATFAQLLCVSARATRASLWAMVVPAAVFNFGRGLLTVQAITLSLEDYPHLAGTATGLSFCVRALLAAVAITALGLVYDRGEAARDAEGVRVPIDASPVPLAAMMLASSALSVAVYVGGQLRARGGRPEHPGARGIGMAALEEGDGEEAGGARKGELAAVADADVAAGWSELGADERGGGSPAAPAAPAAAGDDAPTARGDAVGGAGESDEQAPRTATANAGVAPAR